jgi:UDP-GlcNAc:undecaprenyl-phosphate GlcNAc-1-phosphate transferase
MSLLPGARDAAGTPAFYVNNLSVAFRSIFESNPSATDEVSFALRFAATAIGGLLIVVLGAWDDLRGLSVRFRFVAEIAIATGVVAIGMPPQIGWIPAWIAYPVAVLWIVGIVNAFNLIDGADGLATGIGLVASAILTVVMVRAGHPMIVAFLVTFAGGLIAFLRYNRHPARIFLGSTGSMMIGYTLAVSVLLSVFMRGDGMSAWGLLAPVFVMGVPIYDTASVVLVRMRRAIPITRADTNHTVHRLMRNGFTHQQAVAFMYGMSVCLGMSGILFYEAGPALGPFVLIQAVAILSLIAIFEVRFHRQALRRGRSSLDERGRDGGAIPPAIANATGAVSGKDAGVP